MKKLLNEINVELTIIDKTQFLSPFCGKKKIISSEVASYLENILNYYHPKFNLTLNILTKELTSKEEEQYKSAIINYYENNIIRIKRDLLRNLIISLIMLLIGAFFITIMLIINNHPIWSTILEIIGWVFVWEAVDIFFFKRHELNRELRKSIQIKNAKIIFQKEEKDE